MKHITTESVQNEWNANMLQDRLPQTVVGNWLPAEGLRIDSLLL